VPKALSPSTIKSSEFSTSLVLQSANFAGKEEDSMAFFRRCTSREVLAAILARAALAIFSNNNLVLALSPLGGFLNHSFNSLVTTLATIFEASGVPKISLV
jgi:hypothetical protein